MKFETYAEINLDRLTHNIHILKNHIRKAEIMAVLKADAYGLHAPTVFEHLRSMGISYFAVANVREALQLRRLDSNASILVLGNIHPEYMQEAIRQQLSITVFSKEFWQILKTKLTKKITVHIKLNTGFNRLGFDFDTESIDAIKEIASHPLVNLEGVYSHLALGSAENDKAQFGLFNEMISVLEKEGISFKLKHIADSISAVTYDWSRLDMVRIGAVMYGLTANNYSGYELLDLKGVVRMFSCVSQVRHLKKGEGVSYDYNYRADRDMIVATLAFGYADGYPRCLGNGKGFVIIHGHRAPIVGVMCMDQCIVDISDIPNVKIYDKALLYEIDVSSDISLAAVSVLAGTNKNDLLASIAKRVPRVYIRDNQKFVLI